MAHGAYSLGLAVLDRAVAYTAETRNPTANKTQG